MKQLIFALPLFLSLFSCNNAPAPGAGNSKATDSTIGKVEWYDSSTPLVDTNASVEIVGTGYNWSEGPLWIASLHTLLFSDVPENKIHQWKNGDSVKVYLTPSGYTGTAEALGEIGSNGLALDRNNRLLLCQSGNRQVARMDAPAEAPRATYTALAANYKGKRFNSPNDLTADSRNNIYFTDPVYGLPKGADDPARELPFEGVYCISAEGKVTLLIDSIPRPNGVALSPDEKTLYIGSSDNTKAAWYAYKLNTDGSIQSGGILLNAMPLKKDAAIKQGPDGMEIDDKGNLFSAGPDGINIISPEGKRLGLIKVHNRMTSNCSFNAAKDTLFITADDAVLRVKLK